MNINKKKFLDFLVSLFCWQGCMLQLKTRTDGQMSWNC